MADDDNNIPADPDANTEVSDKPSSAALPKKIGHYSIKRIIASGGMGTVYLAQQEQPRRVVALKVMKKGLTSKSALRRFEFESQILARLKHPNVAQVYEAGTHDDGEGGVPFFAMEYIPNAKTIIEYAKSKKMSTRERLELFAKVCAAVHHGHLKGIIHRDLKPGNILVDSGGEPKVIDFGVARATDSDMAITTLQTDIGQLIGTLQYMSPEQCEGDPHDLDTRSDVYALGVVLYELLTEQLPYDVSKFAMYEAARVVREETPAKPSTINKSFRGDVETITLKALEKDRNRRYESAGDLAKDVNHYLRAEPIEARPAQWTYLTRKLIVRNKFAVSVIGGLVLVLLFGATAAIAMRRARLAADDKRLAQYQLEETQLISSLPNYVNFSDDERTEAYAILERLGERIRNDAADLIDCRNLIDAFIVSTWKTSSLQSTDHASVGLEISVRDLTLEIQDLGIAIETEFYMFGSTTIVEHSYQLRQGIFNLGTVGTAGMLSKFIIDDPPAGTYSLSVVIKARVFHVRDSTYSMSTGEAVHASIPEADYIGSELTIVLPQKTITIVENFPASYPVSIESAVWSEEIRQAMTIRAIPEEPSEGVADRTKLIIHIPPTPISFMVMLSVRNIDTRDWIALPVGILITPDNVTAYSDHAYLLGVKGKFMKIEFSLPLPASAIRPPTSENSFRSFDLLIHSSREVARKDPNIESYLEYEDVRTIEILEAH